jgi:uncharacterized membrane protein
MNSSSLPLLKRSMRLPGRGRRGFSVAGGLVRLWLLPDALLMVQDNRVSEDYTHFELKNIQAIIVRRSRKSAIINWVFSGLIFAIVLLFGILQATGNGGTTEFYVGATLLIAPLVLFLAINLFRGPSCVCHLRTAVQEIELPSLQRLRTARAALARLVPAIEAAQGELSEQEKGELDTWNARYAAGLLDSSSSR